MHGGAPGSGAPRGNRNALKHGRYSRELLAERAQTRELPRQTRKVMLQNQVITAADHGMVLLPTIDLKKTVVPLPIRPRLSLSSG